jgi:hypothetical protein
MAPKLESRPVTQVFDPEQGYRHLITLPSRDGGQPVRVEQDGGAFWWTREGGRWWLMRSGWPCDAQGEPDGA